MSDNRKYIQSQKFKLAGSGISATDTSMTLQSFKTPDGATIAMSDVGTLGTGTLGPGTSREEIITFTGVTQNGDGTATLTGLTRGCDFRSPYTADTSLRKSHSGNEVFILTNNPQFYDSFTNKQNDETVAGLWEFSQVPSTTGGDPVSDEDLVRKAYADALLLGSLTSLRVVMPGTAGETVAAGNLIYFKEADGEWYKCDADTAGTVDNIIMAIAQGAGTDGASITGGVLLFGQDTNQSGMTPGETMYASNTAGAISNTPGTTEVTIGAANSATDLYFMPRYNQQITENQQDALVGTSGTPSSSNKYVTNDDTATAATASKVARRGASGEITVPTTPSASTDAASKAYVDGFLYTSGENLTSGNPVYVNPLDGSLYKAHGFKELDSTAISLTASTTYKLAKLSDTQMMFLTNSSGTLTITVYDINSGTSVATQTVTTSFDTTSISTTLTGATVTRLSDTTFIVFYARGTNSDLYFRTGSISGATITMDTETAYSGTPSFCFGLDSRPGASAGKVVLSYMQGSVNPGTSNSSWGCVLAYLTCSTNTATVTYSDTYSTPSGGAFNQSPVWSVAQFTKGIAYGLYSIADGSGTRKVLYNYIDSASGTTANGKFSLNLENETGSSVSSTYSQYAPYVVGHNGKIYYGWAIYGSTDAVINIKTVLESGTSGTRIVYQSSTTRLAGDTTSSALPMFGNEMGVIVTGFNIADGTGSRLYGSIYIQKDNVYGFYSKSTLGITNTPFFSSHYSNLKDEIVISNMTGYVKQWRLPTLFEGLAGSTVTAPNTTSVNKNFGTTTGLTANTRYFLKDTYTSTGELNTVGTIPVGDSLSTTVIKLGK